MQIEDIAEVSGVWPDLAGQAGLEPRGWDVRVVSRRKDAQRWRIVWRLEREGRVLALKRVLAPVDPAGFLAEVEAHLAVQDRFDAVPQILAVAPVAQAVLMDWAGTETLFDVLGRSDTSGRQQALARAGTWVAEFHQSGFDEGRVFQPKHSVRHLRRLMEEVTQGARAVADAGAWLRHAEDLCARQSAFEGRQTVSCLGHGDLNLRNILFGDAGVRGLDFRGGNPVPVGHDLARLFVHYGALLAAPGGHGGVLPGVDLTGFFDGYDLVGADDPSIGFLTLMRILIDWQTLPAHPARHSNAEAQRYAGLRRLAEAALS